MCHMLVVSNEPDSMIAIERKRLQKYTQPEWGYKFIAYQYIYLRFCNNSLFLQPNMYLQF